MHTVSLHQLGGLAEWFLALPSAARPTLCLQFAFSLQFHLPQDPVVRKQALDLARTAAACLVDTGRTRLAANSPLLADRISRDLDQKCGLPLPLRWPTPGENLTTDPGVVFGFFGGLGLEKGASLIAHAIPRFAARHPEVRFIVHAPSPESDYAAVKILEGVPQVELLRNNFARKQDYFMQFKRAGCILLPYDPVGYACRPSAVLIEALGLGRMIITTKNSSCYADAERYGGKVIAMSDFTSDELFSSLTSAWKLLCTERITPNIDSEVAAENSPAAFCSAVIQLANS